MAKTILKSTTNSNLKPYIGVEGELTLGADNKFHFTFMDGAGNQRKLSSDILGQLGNLEHPASKEVCFKTRHSEYVFEKKIKQRDSLFSYVREKPVESKLPDPIRVRLTSTSNSNLKPYVGAEGVLSLDESNNLHFDFIDAAGNDRSITSKALIRTGDFESSVSKEIRFNTKHSEYVFEKLGKVKDFSQQYAPLNQKIEMANERCQSNRAGSIGFDAVDKMQHGNYGFGR